MAQFQIEREWLFPIKDSTRRALVLGRHTCIYYRPAAELRTMLSTRLIMMPPLRVLSEADSSVGEQALALGVDSHNDLSVQVI